MKPHYWDDALEHLAGDEVLRGVMGRFPDSVLKGRGAPFETLVRAVVGQQISVKAADSVWKKLLGACPPAPRGSGEASSCSLREGDILTLSEAELQACGLSGQKVKYIVGIARGFADGVVHPGLWEGMDDEVVIAELVKLPGIGRWTAEMFLMFNLLRPNVLPVGDLGLLNGFVKLYGPVRGTAKLEGPKRLKKIAAAVDKHAVRWHPYRTVATWFVWRSLDPVEVGY
ncbi:MAG: DNA-3-methyladenine glycosylase 2 family protein [Alphaproteobacteria bacterium]